MEKTGEAQTKKRKGEKQDAAATEEAPARQKKFAFRRKRSEVTQLSSTAAISPERAEILALYLGCPSPPGGGSEAAIHDFLVGQLLPCQAVRAAAVRWGAVVCCEKRSGVPEALAAIVRKMSPA